MVLPMIIRRTPDVSAAPTAWRGIGSAKPEWLKLPI
jgi:hypothetical protein